MTHEPTPSVAATVGLQRKISAAVAAFAALGATTAAVAQQIVYVAEHSQPGGDGHTWQTAFPTIHEAIGLLSGVGPPLTFMEVRIAQGRYFATDPVHGTAADSLVLLSGVSLVGGYRGPFGNGAPHERDPGRFATVIDGDIGVPGYGGDDTENAINIASAAVVSIDGLQFQNMNGSVIRALYSGPTTVARCVFRPGLHGPTRCISVFAHRLVVEDCVFSGQVADDSLVYAWGIGSEVVLRGCEFTGNVTRNSVVEAYALPSMTIDDCRFESNDAGQGVIRAFAADLVQIRNTTVAGTISTASFSFPPISVNGVDWVVLYRCDVRGNMSTSHSGGGLMLSEVGNAMILDSSFTGNIAPLHGGAIYADVDQNLILIGCLIADNFAGGTGAGLRTFGTTNLLNCTVANNQAGQAAGAGIAGDSQWTWALSSILWGNRQVGQPASAATFSSQISPASLPTYSDSVITGVSGGTRNIALDPRFVGPGDYRLQPDSPAINLGLNPVMAPLNGEHDLDGNPRVLGGFVDAGCYERTGLPAPCGPADMGGSAVRGTPGFRVPDGVVSGNDFFVYLDAWMAGDAAADLTTFSVPGTPGYLVPNGQVGNEDYFVFLTLYQQGC